MNGFIEKESKALSLKGTSEAEFKVTIRFGSIEEKKDITVMEEAYYSGDIDLSWSLEEIRALALKKLKG
ncbi:hypothetical protein [Coraliomargarita akajimensis]|uniref:Uncharacterized protein n=1 Tax=Coraliomargarita akajimensis (strain DSM 45221 / IAM 15411 / JCM 23193 / KCTC 12865 / 04OKA010-24) TaxID=583355 RepID=D5EMC9_CORAD|nr:hypothetical protein [Coraliomargarita akajimensis]ADE53335.1 hypothetical protein Caka_0310 [Coraliomargarita akajimensis DSM 45221]